MGSKTDTLMGMENPDEIDLLVIDTPPLEECFDTLDEALWLCTESDEVCTDIDVALFEAAETLDCEAPDVRPRVWRRDWLKGYRTVVFRAQAAVEACRRAVAAVVSVVRWWFMLPVRFWDWLAAIPGQCAAWFMARPWKYLLSVRIGFVFGAIGVAGVAASTLWALSTTLPYLPPHRIEPALPATRDLPNARLSVPSELAWFFIQFPYVSDDAAIRAKNHHTFVIIDTARHREYVVQLAQKYRRVEIYNEDSRQSEQVQIYTPGTKKVVWFRGPKIVGQSAARDGNLWMWQSPLWNPVHLKIYSLADLWLDSPYKRYSCAGFVHQFLGDAGVKVPIMDAWDFARQPWTRVSEEEMEPGDIITIKAGSESHRRLWHHRITHVGVYIGHGKLIHAATSARSSRAWVRISDVKEFRKRIDKVLRPPELL